MADELPSTAVMRLAGLRAAGMAAQFLAQLQQSDVPRSHWEEVANWLLELIRRAEAEGQ